MNNKVKMKKVKKLTNTWILTESREKLWNRNVTVIPIAVGALVTVTKNLKKSFGWFGLVGFYSI